MAFDGGDRTAQASFDDLQRLFGKCQFTETFKEFPLCVIKSFPSEPSWVSRYMYIKFPSQHVIGIIEEAWGGSSRVDLISARLHFLGDSTQSEQEIAKEYRISKPEELELPQPYCCDPARDYELERQTLPSYF